MKVLTFSLVLLILLPPTFAQSRPQESVHPELIVQLGHAQPVDAVAYLDTTQGQFVVTGSQDHTARLWDAATGSEIRRFLGHQDAVTSIAVSRDNNFILTGSKDHTARLWEVGSERQAQIFSGHEDIIFSVALSSDGEFALTGSRDGTARIWNVRTGVEVQRFVVPSAGGVLSVAFSPNGEQILTGSGLLGSQDNTARLWDVKSGKEVKQFVEDGRVSSVSFSPNSQYVLTGNWGNTATLWDAATGGKIRAFEGHTKFVNAATFSPDGKYVLTGSSDNSAKLWEVATGKEIRHFTGHARVVSSVAFARNGKAVLTGSWDNTARLWDITDGSLIRTFTGHPSNISSVFFSYDGRYIYTGSWGDVNDGARVWDVKSGKEVRRFDGTRAVLSIAASRDGRYVLAGDLDNRAWLWDAATGQEINKFVRHTGGVSGVGFSPDGKRILTQSWDNTVYVWDISTGAVIWSAPDKPGHWDAVLSPDGRYVLTGGLDNKAHLWEITTNKEVQTFTGHLGVLAPVAFSPDGKFVLTAGGDQYAKENTARLWDISTGKQVQEYRGHSSFINCVAFSPDQRFIFTGGEDGTVRLWDIPSGQEVRRFAIGSGHILSISVSPNGEFFITGSDDGVARLWSRSKNEELCELISLGHGEWIVVDPKGRFDTSSLEEVTKIHWTVSDDPLRLLPIEIFMRDYYQPGLLTRLLKNVPLKEVPSIASLNRVLPKVTITDVQPEEGVPDRVSVKVDVEEGQDISSRAGNKEPLKSGAYNLRLFRDGQLVAQCPDPPAVQKKEAELSIWRQAYQIPLGLASGPKYTCIFHDIRLPRRAAVMGITFTAYAFNEDRVKSETAEPWQYYYRPDYDPSRKPRAYVIRVGVDANQSDWNLDFAAKSADNMRRPLYDRLSKGYEVIDVPLLSTREPDGFRPDQAKAKKENIRAVLDLLAGKVIKDALRDEVDPDRKLCAATPDDMVLLYISSHGYADPRGNFFIIPYDTGKSLGVSETVLNNCLSRSDHPQACEPARKFLARSVSSEDLADWWRDVDAREMVMILDSCHSAAVSGREFRPGPLGDAGFGQLSYDKGMLILAATQPDKTALSAIREGVEGSLLSSILINIMSSRSRLTMGEWLKEAEQQVPEQYKRLYPEVKEEEVQLPVLFDFTK